jgi:hypothetical protein
MNLRAGAVVLLVQILAGCAVAPRATLQIPGGPNDVAPIEILDAVVARAGNATITVDDSSSHCWDMNLPQWSGRRVDTLDVESRDALRSCYDRSATKVRMPEALRTGALAVMWQSDRRHPAASIVHPVLFGSRAGLSADGRIAVVDVYTFCGGPICASSELLWFHRTERGWQLVASWLLQQS